MIKNIMLILLLLVVLLTACESTTSQQLSFVSTIEKENCHICGYNSVNELKDHLGEDNIALVNLSTFDFFCIEINRYDHEGRLIEEATGAMMLGAFVSGNIDSTIVCDPDRGNARVDVASLGNRINATTLGGLLCQNCLDKFNYYAYEHDEIRELAVINMLTMELRPLENNCPWFTFDNFIISIDFENDGSMKLDITYRPLRYQNAGTKTKGSTSAGASFR